MNLSPLIIKWKMCLAIRGDLGTSNYGLWLIWSNFVVFFCVDLCSTYAQYILKKGFDHNDSRAQGIQHKDTMRYKLLLCTTCVVFERLNSLTVAIPYISCFHRFIFHMAFLWSNIDAMTLEGWYTFYLTIWRRKKNKKSWRHRSVAIYKNSYFVRPAMNTTILRWILCYRMAFALVYYLDATNIFSKIIQARNVFLLFNFQFSFMSILFVSFLFS